MNQTLHITQDHHGFWMVSREDQDGALTLEVFQAVSREHAWEDADQLVREGHYPDALICVDAPRRASPQRDPSTWPTDYRKPDPQKCRSHGN